MDLTSSSSHGGNFTFSHTFLLFLFLLVFFKFLLALKRLGAYLLCLDSEYKELAVFMEEELAKNPMVRKAYF